jgi:hypothetical protein
MVVAAFTVRQQVWQAEAPRMIDDVVGELTLSVWCPDCTVDLGEVVVRSTNPIETAHLFRRMQWIADQFRCSTYSKAFRQLSRARAGSARAARKIFIDIVQRVDETKFCRAGCGSASGGVYLTIL